MIPLKGPLKETLYGYMESSGSTTQPKSPDTFARRPKSQQSPSLPRSSDDNQALQDSENRGEPEPKNPEKT